MRFVKPSVLNGSSNKTHNPRDARRKRIRKEKFKITMQYLWRFSIFSSINLCLFLLMISSAFRQIHIENVFIKGNNNISKKIIIDALGVSLPNQLIKIKTYSIKAKLLAKLPLKNIQINRKIFPSRLEILISEREPFAFAQRKVINGYENGFIDSDGFWIPGSMAGQLSLSRETVLVEGWKKDYSKMISKILKNKDSFGSPLKKINLSPNGEFTLQTTKFKRIQLGANIKDISNYINAINQLSDELNFRLPENSETSIDLRDPAKPELQIQSN